MAALALRSPVPGDYGWVIQRHGALYAEEYGFDISFEALVARIVADFAQNRDTARERAWIAVLDGAPVGSVFCVDAGNGVAKLRLLLVDPAARGRQLGIQLVEQCIAFARAAGISGAHALDAEPARGRAADLRAHGLRARRAGASNGAVRHAAGVGDLAARALSRRPERPNDTRRECHLAPPLGCRPERPNDTRRECHLAAPARSRHVCSRRPIPQLRPDGPRGPRDRRRARPW